MHDGMPYDPIQGQGSRSRVIESYSRGVDRESRTELNFHCFLFALSVSLLFHPFPFYQNRRTVSNLGLVFCADFVLYVFLVKYACLFL